MEQTFSINIFQFLYDFFQILLNLGEQLWGVLNYKVAILNDTPVWQLLGVGVIAIALIALVIKIAI